MATTAKKPTPKSQKATLAKSAAESPTSKLMAVSGEAPADDSTQQKSAIAKGASNKTTTAKSAKAVPNKNAPAKADKGAPAQPIDVSKLTDEDILRMPEEDYMNEVQLQYFKAKLLAMRAEILANARETGEHLKENEVFADPNDRATVEEENMLEQRVRDRERKLLKKIEQSLARIESGEYGYCLETGEPIGIARLLARPTAELSIEAQEKHERMERLYAD